MPADTWLHTSRNAPIATSGAPKSSHNWRMCARGSSPRQIATTGLRNPSPTSESARMIASIAAFTRGQRAFACGGDVFAGAGGATLTGATGNGFGLLAGDDIAVLDLLLALEAERQFFDVRVRLAPVVFDAVDEILRRRAKAIGRKIEVGRIGLFLGDEGFGRLEKHLRAVDLLRGLGVPRVGFTFGNLAPAAHLREIPDRVRVERVVSVVLEEHVEI